MRLILSVFLLFLSAGVWAASLVVPTPVSTTQLDGSYTLPSRPGVKLDDSSLESAMDYLKSFIPGAEVSGHGEITLAVEADTLAPGAYTLSVKPEGIAVKANNYEGVINGLSTLKQLLDGANGRLACVEIADEPYYRWRGMMLDCVRHFFTIEEIEGIIDNLADYKLNTFHWHLTDNQGWRAEIKRYPELTERGAYNPLNNLDRMMMHRTVAEHNPDLAMRPEHYRITAEGDTLYGGYYTQEQMRHIVDYAGRRGITVVPEIESPGHARILTRVLGLGCGGNEAEQICTGNDSALAVMKNIFAEIFDIFPSKYVHVGGDEVDKSGWRSCPDCLARVAELDLENTDALQAWFTRELELYFRNNGRTLVGWDEIAYDGIGAETAIHWWRGFNRDVVDKATADGKRVVASPTDCLYFDYPAWDSYIGKILALDPAGMGLKESQRRLINGLQANVWTEMIPTVRRMHYQVFPRFFALSESAWNKPANRMGEAQYWAVLPQLLRRLDRAGISYAIPELQGCEPVYSFDDYAIFEPHTRMAGAEIRYTTDGSVPTAKSRLYRGPIRVDRPTTFSVGTFRPDGTMSDYRMVKFEKE